MDNFYNLESIGLKDEGSLHELEQIRNFSDFISLQDGYYYVHLPCNQDLVKKVPNLKVSLAVAERVYKNLEKQSISDAYEVLEQQETLGIVEPVKQKNA